MLSYIVRGTALTLLCTLSAFLCICCMEMAKAVPATPAIPSLAYMPAVGVFGCLATCLWAGRRLTLLTRN